MKKIIVASVLMSMIGCTPIIKDRDFEKEERDYIKAYGIEAAKDPLYGAPTGTVIQAGEQDGVRVTMSRGVDDVSSSTGTKLQNWYAVVVNGNDEPKCVAILWKLMDFTMITDHTTFIYLKPYESLMDYAKFKQRMWDLDGVSLVLPGSGYIDTIFVEEPTERNDCDFQAEVVDDKDAINK